MASFRTWLRYAFIKMAAVAESNFKSYEMGIIRSEQLTQKIMKSFFMAPMTFTHSYKGEAMAPTFSSKGATLLIRPLPGVLSRFMYVGDVVLFKNPTDSGHQEKILVRRIAAKQGDKMVSTDENDKPFYIEDRCYWVLSDNESLSPKDATDSRTFGPLPSSEILGRAIYFYQSPDEHGIIQNSEIAKADDVPVLAAELDIERLSKQS